MKTSHAFPLWRWRAAGWLAVGFVCSLVLAPIGRAADVVTIGDSLTAEYDTIPDIPGFPDDPTAYAEITVDGWESMSWVEVLRRLRRGNFDFGGNKKLPDLWSVPRMSGFEWNWAVPGITAGQYEDFVTATLTSNPAYYSLRRPLDEQLRERADRVVIWLGGNDFRENYGRLYDGDDSDSLIDGLIDDLGRVIDYVKGRDSRLQIVLANIPDLGAAPSKKAAHPDSQKRARVTAATEIANARITVLAAQKGVAIADVYAQTARLVRDEPTYFGAIQIINEEHPDNNPRYHFTRDGLHPNTASQIEIARIIIRAFNQGYGAGIRNINDAEALNLLGIDPLEPYRQWIARFDVPKINFKADTDADGLGQLVEYAFGMNPSVPDADQLPVTVGGPVPGISGDVSVSYRPDPTRSRHARVKVQYLVNGTSWRNIPAENLVANDDGSFVAVIPNTDRPVVAKRLKVSIVPPSGSTTTIAVALPFE